jgi:hypothetical protein
MKGSALDGVEAAGATRLTRDLECQRDMWARCCAFASTSGASDVDALDPRDTNETTLPSPGARSTCPGIEALPARARGGTCEHALGEGGRNAGARLAPLAKGHPRRRDAGWGI